MKQPDKIEEHLLEAMDSILTSADHRFAKADKLHSALLPEGVSFTNHNHPFQEGAHRAPLPALMKYLEAYTAEQRKVATRMRYKLNDHLENFGLGIVSVSIEPSDQQEEPVLPHSDSKPLTIGSVLPPIKGRQQVLALFKIDPENAEEVSSEGEIHARTFAFGERSPRFVSQEPDILPGWKKPIIVPGGSAIGVSVPVLDENKLKESKLSYSEINTNRKGGLSQLYACRNLTMKRALEIIRGG